MCGCEPTFTCGRCEPRRAVDLGEWSWRELEQWQRDQDLGTPDFEKPLLP